MKNNLETKENWEKIPLGNLVSNIVDNRGKTPPNNPLGGKKLVETYQVSRNSTYPLEGGNKQKYVDDSTFFSWFRSGHPKSKDILFTTVGEAVPQFCLVPDNYEFCIAQNLVALRFNEGKVDPLFVLYYFRQRKFIREVVNRMITTAQPSIKIPHLLSIEMKIPNLPEQKEIASVLSSLDDKIELLKKQNETLEEIAKTIFKEWFVEFNFPNEKGQPYKSSGGKMIDSELGEIPEGWKVGTLSDFANIVCGKTPSKLNGNFYEGEIPFIKIPDMHNNTFIISTLDTLTKEGENTQKNKTIPPYSICVSCIATVGLVAMTSKFSQTNQQINSLIPHKDEYRYFLFLFLRNMNKDLQNMASGGTTTANLNTSNFSKIKLIYPNDTVFFDFHKIINNFFEKIISNSKQIQILEKNRNTLLPKLMNGEVRVK